MSYFRVNERCTGCLSCVQNCPAGALRYTHRDGNRIIQHNIIACARCGNCWRVCPEDAIEFKYLVEGGWDEVTSLKCLRCSICGEPVFTVEHKRALGEKYAQEAETLCPLHKGLMRAESWIRAAGTRARPGGPQS